LADEIYRFKVMNLISLGLSNRVMDR